MKERTAHRDPIAHLRTMVNEWKHFHGLTTVQVVIYLAMAIGWFSETAYVDHKRQTEADKPVQ